MKSLLQLKPYFIRYRWKLIFGIIFVLGSNAMSSWIPLLVKGGIDTVMVQAAAKTEKDVASNDARVSASTDAAASSTVDASVAKTVAPAPDAVALPPIKSVAAILGKPAVGHSLMWYAMLIIGAAAASAVCRFFIRQTLIVLSREIEFDLRQDLWGHVQQLPMRYFSQNSTGAVMAHLTNDVNAVRMFLGPSIMYTVDNLSHFVMVLGVMLYFSPQLTVIALLPLPLLSFLVYYVGRMVHSRFGAIQESFSDLTARAQTTFSGVRVIKSYVREEHQQFKFEEQSANYRDRQLELIRIEAFYRPLLYAVPGASIILTIWAGGVMHIHHPETITPGLLFAFLMYLTQLIWPMIAFGWVVNVTQRSAASMTRLLKLRDAPLEITDPVAPKDSPVATPEIPAIEFRDVSFRFTPDGPDVLRHVNLSIMHGETLAIVGRTGSGKTSLVQLIPRLYDVTAGQVLVDGVDVREWRVDSLRERIGMAPQEAFLFSDTLANNLIYGMPNATEAERDRAVAIAQLDKDILDFPLGYDTVLGERGITLSGGQKQRASLARALLREPPILILDDTLSAVDAQTEEDILHGLRSLNDSGARAGVFISHRLSTIQDADQIIVMHDGEIVERGRHEQLIALNGRYADVHRKQLLESELRSI